jgi:hypothetical protein
MHPWTRLLVGAITFLAVHLIVLFRWEVWFGGSTAFAAWFMNASGAVAFTVAVFVLVNAAVAVAHGQQPAEQAAVGAGYVAAGAVVVMTVVLMTLPGGAGTLFPIAIAIGATLIGISSVAGAMAGWLFTRRTAAPSTGRP